VTGVVRTLDVAAPAPVTWAVVEELRRMPELSSSTVSVDGPDRLTEVGQTFRQVVKLAGRSFTSRWELLELDPGRCLRVEGELMRGVRYGITQAVEPVGDDASRLTFTMTYELPFGLLGRLAGRLGAEHRALDEADDVMAGIKRVAEAHVTAARTTQRTPQPQERA
jgi:hypothetical protein